MSRQSYLRISLALLIILIAISSCKSEETPVPPAAYPVVATSTVMPSQEPQPTPTRNVTPVPEAENPSSSSDAWLDDAIDVDQFAPDGKVIIHFSTPISSKSSSNPVLFRPDVSGGHNWDATGKTLTFVPDHLLDSKRSYTLFLDPLLRSAEGEELSNSPEWILHIKPGPKINKISPEPGSLITRSKTIKISFDTDMDTSLSTGFLTIAPPVAYDLEWVNNRSLHINVEEPFEPDQRYDFTLSGGINDNSLRAINGTYLEDEFSWFYWQVPIEVTATTLKSKTIKLEFNYVLDQDKSGLSFKITPELSGNWNWVTSQKAFFVADDKITAAQEYSVELTSPLVDSAGFEIRKLPEITFSGTAPIRVLDIEKSKYSDYYYAEADMDAIRIEFPANVDHVSAEKAFSISPAVSGRFRWEKDPDGSKEVMIYTLYKLLDPSTYTVEIDANLRDIQGQRLIARPYTQSFDISRWGNIRPSFGEYGDNIQVVDVNGARKIQFSGGGDDTSFAAYPFELIDFAKLYVNHYVRRSYANVHNIPIPSELEPAAIWRNISSRKVGGGDIVETTLPVELEPGLYIVDLREKKVLYDQMFLVVTRNTLVVKNDGEELFVWLTDINGENVPDAQIRVYSTTGEKIREGKTDESGQYRVSIPRGTEPMLVSARVMESGLSGDVALVGFSSWGSYYPYIYRDRSSLLPEGQPYLSYIYTERPIYRPGQTVNFKVLVRKDNDARYSLPDEGTPVKVRILDARNNTIESMDLFTNRFGTVNSMVEISEGAMLGTYQIDVDVDGVLATEIFKVEDYRKPDYQIEITSLQPEKENSFVRGEEMKVEVDASYYFGEPLADTKLRVKFYYGWEVKTEISGSLVTDKDGKATLNFPAPYSEDDYYYYRGYGNKKSQSIRMEVVADDGSNQSVTGSYYFTVYPASEQISLQTGGYYKQPGEAFTATVKIADLFENPVEGRELELSIHSWNRTSYEFGSDKEAFSLVSNANGLATQEIALDAGYHKLTLEGDDEQGHKMEVSKYVYVFKDKQDWFMRSQSEFIMISAESDSYKPYETARFAIESTFSGPALISFERGSVINTKMIELTAPLTIFETQIIPEHAPNVYVTVNAWQAASQDVYRYDYEYPYQTSADSYLRLAKTQVQVDSSAKALDINIVTDKDVYAPGDELIADITVKDADGNPVLAELSLAVVDEAIFALASDPSGDIFDAFYGPRAHSVRTFDSMAPIRIISEGGRGGGGNDVPPPDRSNFPDTSAWFPEIETDENGHASVSIVLPDNTTSWRLTVKAISINNKVGQAIANVETKKDVFLRPVLPRILTNGDQVLLTAFIHNYSTEIQNVKVDLSAPGLDIRTSNDETIILEPGDVIPVGWQVNVEGVEETEVTVTATGAAGMLDAIRLPLLIQPAAIRDVQNQSGEFSDTLELDFTVPEIEAATSEVRLTLNRSQSGVLLNGLEYLTGYPYGCVEQTMSRALPNAAVSQAAVELGIGGQEMQTRLEPLIWASIQRLYGFQHYDGGWGWWTDDASDPYQTAWVLFGLSVIENSGYAIEPMVMNDAANWLDERLDDQSSLDIRTRAYVLYSLAISGRGDLEHTEALVAESIYELDPFSQAALALALNQLEEKDQAKEILEILSQSALFRNEYVYWPQAGYDKEYNKKTMSSSIRTTALVLSAFVEIDAQHELIPGMVEYLTDQRQGLRGWGTTNETSFTILALTEYLAAQERDLEDASYEVLVNDKSLFTDTLEEDELNISFDIPVDELQNGLNTLMVKTETEAPIYYDLSTSFDLLQDEIDAAGAIKVTRQYLDPETEELLEDFEAGQLVKVKVTVRVPEDAYFMAVEDHLPGGLEALNEGLSATHRVDSSEWPEYSPMFYWEDYGYNYKEIRGDRVVFFITSLPKGTRTFTYYARATTPGQFTALPVQAYAMYDLNMWGRSASALIRIDNENR